MLSAGDTKQLCKERATPSNSTLGGLIVRNLLALFGAALVAFAVVGWYRGWYQFTTEPEPDGHREVKININGPKIEKDVQQGTQKLEQALENKLKGSPGQPTATPQAGQQLPPGTNAVPGSAQFAPPAGFGPVYASPENEGYVLPPATPVPATPPSPK
jgi:hypothetical protein